MHLTTACTSIMNVLTNSLSCHSDISPCPSADSCHFSGGDFWPSDSGCTCLGPRVWLILRTSPGQHLHVMISFLEQRPVPQSTCAPD